VGYVDLRKRREDLAQSSRRRAGLRHDITDSPRLFIVAGLVLGVSAVIVFRTTSSYDTPFTPPPGEPFVWALPLGLLAVAFLFLGYLHLRHRHPQNSRPGAGAEKQLLMAIQDTGGSITPVEAALRTSLTVDEAEEILSRLASRGHLLVESRDGALSYALPGRRSESL
jgi:hypothetical protein